MLITLVRGGHPVTDTQGFIQGPDLVVVAEVEFQWLTHNLAILRPRSHVSRPEFTLFLQKQKRATADGQPIPAELLVDCYHVLEAFPPKDHWPTFHGAAARFSKWAFHLLS